MWWRLKEWAAGAGYRAKSGAEAAVLWAYALLANALLVAALLALAALLLAFHLYLLKHWEKVRRPRFFKLGCVGLVVVFAGNFFLIGGYLPTMIVAEVFYCAGLLAALIGAVGACIPPGPAGRSRPDKGD